MLTSERVRVLSYRIQLYLLPGWGTKEWLAWYTVKKTESINKLLQQAVSHALLSSMRVCVCEVTQKAFYFHLQSWKQLLWFFHWWVSNPCAYFSSFLTQFSCRMLKHVSNKGYLQFRRVFSKSRSETKGVLAGLEQVLKLFSSIDTSESFLSARRVELVWMNRSSLFSHYDFFSLSAIA